MMKELELLKTELKLRGFSPMTVRNYSFFVDKFIQFSNKSSDILAEEDVKHYLSSLIETKSKSTTMLAAAAIKFFFTEVLKKQLTNIKLPKQDKRLPDVLTKEEVKVLIDTADTTKSRLMLSLLYSSGLRVSELVNLKSQDIRFEENIGWVRGGKGGKDRMFLLSGKITEELNSYIKNHAQDFVFINSDNDPWGCNDKQGRIMFNNLGGTFIIRHDEGHMGSTTYKQPYKKFPLLLKIIE